MIKQQHLLPFNKWYIDAPCILHILPLLVNYLTYNLLSIALKFFSLLFVYIALESLPSQKHFKLCMLLKVVLFPECPRPSDPLPLICHVLGSAWDCSMIHSLSFHAFHECVQSFCVSLLSHWDFLLLKLYYMCTHITGISLQFRCSIWRQCFTRQSRLTSEHLQQ